MRLSIRFLLLLAPVLAGVVFGFNALMDRLERKWSLQDLYDQAELIFQSIQDPVFDSVAQGKLNALHRIYRRIENHPHFKGIIVCNLKNKIISKSPNFPRGLKCTWNPEVRDEKQAAADTGIIIHEKISVHRTIFLLSDEEKVAKAYVMFLQDPAYLKERSDLSRRYTIYAFLGLAFLISIITLLVYRWSVSKPIQQFGEVMKGVITGDTEKISKALEDSDFAPLVRDFDEMLFQMKRKKRSNGRANGKGEENPNVWTPERLHETSQKFFGESKICVIANESPYVHNRKGHRVEVSTPASGFVQVMDSVMQSVSGIWISRGTGSADQESADRNGRLLVPPDNHRYALKRIWLSRDEEQGFYFGFANEGLWPLCHIAHERPNFRLGDWERYVEVNAKFTSHFNDEVKGTRPVVMIQNYNLALMPEMIRRMRPDAMVSLFWHIPWPSAETIRICPWRKELLTGMLGADVIGFQSQQHCNNFFDTVDRFLEARVSRDQFSVTIQGHTCHVKPFPTSVEWPGPFEIDGDQWEKNRQSIISDLSLSPDCKIGIGVDRLDYTKGIIERLEAIERFLEKNSDQVGKFVFVEMASPTNRMHLKRYQDLNSEIQKVADRINWKFYSGAYRPIVLRMHHHSREELFRYYRAADFCLVTPIHDGMNLVSKEFISARDDEDGVLILSSFAGARQELKDAIIVNPYDVEECSEAVRQAVTMTDDERKSRMQRMRKVVSENNVYSWGNKFLTELHRVSEIKLQGHVTHEADA